MVDVQWAKIGPEAATRALERNTRNRKIRDRTVTAFAADMQAGRWNENNGETIKVSWPFAAEPDDDDVLVDGQHRLWAIVQADMIVNMLVAYEVDPSAQDTIDTGVKRTYADVLHLRGEADPVNLAAIIKRVHVWISDTTNETPGRQNPHVTTPQLDVTFEKHPEIREARVASARFYELSGGLAPKSVIGLLTWIFNRLDDGEKDAEFFFNRISDGQNMGEGDPIYTLRKKLLENKQSTSQLNDRVMLAFFLKTWNAWRDGEQLKILRFRPGGASPERFPVPH